MKYLLLIYGDETAMESYAADATPEERDAQVKVWYDYGDWLTEKGWYLGGDALQLTSTATTVRAVDGKPVVTDGPFAETKEQLGGLLPSRGRKPRRGDRSRFPVSRRVLRNDRATPRSGLPRPTGRLTPRATHVRISTSCSGARRDGRSRP